MTTDEKELARYMTPRETWGDIVAGETDQEMWAELKKQGLVTPETEVDDRLTGKKAH